MQRYLIVGRCRVRVEAPIQNLIQDTVNVSVDSEVRVDVRLGVGEVSQTVEVSAEVGILKTERSDVATTYTDRVITNLPVLNRRFTNFQLMTPGVVSFPTSLTAASAENPQGSYRMLVNGQSFAGTSHLLDGTDNHDAVLGWIVINPTLESVTEAKITTANYNAEFGVASAGVVSAQTRSGYPIYDPASGPPASRTGFPGDIIPANRLSAPAQNLLKLIPMPNTAAALDQPNFTASGGVKFNDDAFNVRAAMPRVQPAHMPARRNPATTPWQPASITTCGPSCSLISVLAGFVTRSSDNPTAPARHRRWTRESPASM